MIGGFLKAQPTRDKNKKKQLKGNFLKVYILYSLFHVKGTKLIVITFINQLSHKTLRYKKVKLKRR